MLEISLRTSSDEGIADDESVANDDDISYDEGTAYDDGGEGVAYDDALAYDSSSLELKTPVSGEFTESVFNPGFVELIAAGVDV